MTAPPVLFDDQIPEQDRGRIKEALSRVVSVEPSLGQWQSPDQIKVLQKLTGGRSGALVVRIELGRGEQRDIRIMKIGSDAAREWQGFLKVFEPRPSVLWPGIDAVTRGVLAGSEDEDEAVVYAAVEQFAAAKATTLEAVVTSAADGAPGAVAETVAVIDELFQRAPSVLYSGWSISGETTRESMGHTLGPAIRLAGVRIGGGEPPVRVGPRSRRGPARMRPRDVQLAGLDLPGSGAAVSGVFTIGSEVLLREFRLLFDDGRWVARSRDGEVTVELTLAGEPEDEPGEFSWPDPAEEVDLAGTIDATRSVLTWERIQRAIAGIDVPEPGLVTVSGTRVAHPFAALRDVVMRNVTGLVTSAVHGDLNPGNVLIARQEPFLIDYAKAELDRPILGDLAWLELNLLRGPLSAGLSFADLVRVQRVLALSDRVASAVLARGGDPPEPPAVLARGGDPPEPPAVAGPAMRDADDALIGRFAADQRGLAALIRVLGTIRHHARLIYPDRPAAAQPWWREYAAQLLLAAHRMCKWPDELQTGAAWPAQVAAAAVATEQLLDSQAYRLWAREELADAVATVLPLLRPGLDALLSLGDPVASLDHHRASGGPVLDEQLRRFRVEALSTVPISVPPARMAELERAHYLYIDLPVTYLTGSARPMRAGSSAGSVAAAEPRLVVVGGIGTGKTALLDELEYQDIGAISGPRLPSGVRRDTPAGQLPVRIAADDLARACADATQVANTGADQAAQAEHAFSAGVDVVARQVPTGAGSRVAESLLATGALHLMIDGFDRLGPGERRDVAEWLEGIGERFRRVTVTVCCRGTGPPAELSGWPAVVLAEPDDQQRLGYLARCRSTDSSSAGGISALLDLIRDRPAAPVLRTLARTPLQLYLLASTSGDGARARTIGDLTDVYMRELESRVTGSPGQLMDYAQRLAVQQVGGSGELGPPLELIVTEAAAAAGPDAAEQLLQLGVVTRDGDLIRFRLPVFGDYFAARALLTATAADRRELVLRFAWRDAFTLLVSFTSAGPDVLGELVRAVCDADPEYAARLVRSAADAPAELVRWLITRQQAVLRNDQMGEVAWRLAAQALATVGSQAAYRRLLEVLGEATADLAAREFSLSALVSAHQLAEPGPRAWLGAALTARIGSLLADPDIPPSLRQAAVAAVGESRLHGLELLVAGQIRLGGPWEVVHAAKSALEKVGVRLPADLLATYEQAEAARLTRLERELPTVTSAASANLLQTERYRMLAAIRGADRIPELLRRRFDFEIGEAVADLIDAPPASGSDATIAADPEWLVLLTGSDPSPERLLAAISGQEPLAAQAAAHRLLRDRPGLAADAFKLLSGDDRLGLAPLTAAVASPDVPLSAVEHYFQRVLGAVGDGQQEILAGLAALARTVAHRDPLAGIRSIWRAQRYLAERGVVSRLYWPWSSAMARFGGTPAQLDVLLSSGTPEETELAIDALASSSFLLTCGRARPHSFTTAARERLLHECTTAGPPRAAALLRAAASVGLHEAIPAVSAARAGRSLADLVHAVESAPAVTIALPPYGLIEAAPQADLLAALGYLARMTPGPAPIAAEIHGLLTDLDCRGLHPSVATGRLIGLGYLGDWQHAVDALGSDDSRLPEIAGNAIANWTPGPWTPRGLSDPASVAGKIARRLADPDVGPSTRSALLDLKLAAERRAGALERMTQA